MTAGHKSTQAATSFLLTPDSNNTAASCKQRPHTASVPGTRHPNPRSDSFTRSGINYRLQKHETSAYLHMIRHFSPFHAPLTPPLMGKESGSSAPAGSSRENSSFIPGLLVRVPAPWHSFPSNQKYVLLIFDFTVFSAQNHVCAEFHPKSKVVGVKFRETFRDSDMKLLIEDDLKSDKDQKVGGTVLHV